MSKFFTALLVPLLFVITGIMAIVQERDYWEAACWFCFAVTVAIFALKPLNDPATINARFVAYFFGALGLLLLILRVAGVLPEPVRPLP